MNDLDLRTALHREAELVGEPSPDLLDQLAQRRRDQRRQRVGMLTAGLAVAVIAAGIPVGASFMTRSDVVPATQTVGPTPTTTPEVVPTPAPTPDPVAPTAVEPPTAGVPPVVDVVPPCPDFAILDAALPQDTGTTRYEVFPEQPVCQGVWAAAGYSQQTFAEGKWMGDGQAGVFHFVDGAWTWLDRYTTEVCDDPELPAAVHQRACLVD